MSDTPLVSPLPEIETIDAVLLLDDIRSSASRLASCRDELKRLRGLGRWRWRTVRWATAWRRAIAALLGLRERMPDTFWRAFVLVIGTSLVVATVFLATRNTTAMGVAAAITFIPLSLLMFWPTDQMLDLRRQILAHVIASANHEHQVVSGLIEVTQRRHDLLHDRHRLLKQQPPPPSPPPPLEILPTLPEVIPEPVLELVPEPLPPGAVVAEEQTGVTDA